MGYVGRRADDVFRRTALNELLAGTIEGGGSRQTGRNIEVALKRKGVSAFRDSLGREWSLKNYARMVARTTAGEAASMGTLNRLAENGVLVRIIVAANACDECKKHKDEIYSISGSHPRYPQLEEVPPYHPNCSCLVSGYIEGLSGEHPDEIRRQAEDVIAPGGSPGTPGKRQGMYIRPGGREAAKDVFEQLKALGTPIDRPRYPGEEIDIPGIGPVGYRPKSRYGEWEPTIDVNATINGIRIRKLKFKE